MEARMVLAVLRYSSDRHSKVGENSEI